MRLDRRALGRAVAGLVGALALLFLLPTMSSAFQIGTAGVDPVATGAKVPGDFNDDFKPDLLFQHAATGRLAVWMMDGATPAERVPTAPSGNGDATLVAIGTDDFDGDFKSDILFYGTTDGALTIWHMDGVNMIGKSRIAGAFKPYEPVSVLDYDRDGNSDILFQHRGNGADLFVLQLRGTEVVAKVPLDLRSVEPFLNWRVVGTADFDRDGDADLVLSRHARAVETIYAWADVVAIAFMSGTVGSIEVLGQVGDRNWVIRSVTDLTGDGWPDLVWENGYTGDAGLWEMVGPKVRARYPIAFAATFEGGWHVVGPR